MTPTEQEIQEAKDLQRLGLCQGAKALIKKRKYKPHNGAEYEELVICGATMPGRKVGPLPTANEVWPVMFKLMEKTGLKIALDTNGLWLHDADRNVHRRFTWKIKEYEGFMSREKQKGDYEFNSAMRQALIALKQG